MRLNHHKWSFRKKWFCWCPELFLVHVYTHRTPCCLLFFWHMYTLSFSYFENIMHSCGTCLLCPQPPLYTHHPLVKGVSGSTQQLHLWSQILVKCIVKQILVPLCHCWVELVSNIWMPFLFCKCRYTCYMVITQFTDYHILQRLKIHCLISWTVSGSSYS